MIDRRPAVAAVLLAVALSAAPAPTSAAEKPTAAKAQALADAGDWEAAAAAWQAVVESEPDNGSAWSGLGDADKQLGRYDEAVAAYRKALDQGFRTIRTMLEIAFTYGQKGDEDQVVAWLEKVAATGVKPYRAVAAAPELERFRDDPKLGAVLTKLKPCATPEYRQLDFWLGTWEVTNNATGKTQSTNHVSSLYGGCVVREEYESQTGYAGTSLSFYDAARGKWHQTWVDNQGNPLYLEGGLVDGAMVMTSAAGSSPRNRITWTPQPDGGVRQVWEMSTDEGSTWRVLFDGTYRKKKQP